MAVLFGRSQRCKYLFDLGCLVGVRDIVLIKADLVVCGISCISKRPSCSVQIEDDMSCYESLNGNF